MPPVSRDSVQVVLRMSTSTSPEARIVGRSLALIGRNLTLLGSSKIAAAIARQSSTSRPLQDPLSSGRPKPARPGLTPQINWPRAFTWSSVPARAEGRRRAEGRADGRGSTRSPDESAGFAGIASPAPCRASMASLAPRREAGPGRRRPPWAASQLGHRQDSQFDPATTPMAKLTDETRAS